MRTVLIAPILLVAALPAAADDLVFENDAFTFVLGADGIGKRLTHKPTGRELLADRPTRFAYIRKGSKTYPATAVERQGEHLVITFADSGASAVYTVDVRPRYIVFELAAVHGEGVEQCCLAQVRPAVTARRGWWLNVQWNDAFAVCLLGLSDRVHTGGMRALVHEEFGLDGRRAALIAAPTPDLLDVVRQVELDQGLPCPTIDGHWAKTSPDVNRGYFFVDLTAANVDEVIRYAKMGQFTYVMTYSGTWSTSLGSYPIRETNFPDGEASLKATVGKCHAAGLKVGLHMLTSFIHKHDPLVRPVPHPGLLKDAEARLAADVDAKATEIRSATPLDAFPAAAAYYGAAKQGMTFQIGDEIVRYREIGGPGRRTFLGCTRGYTGTKAAAHKAGATIAHLAERYGSYLADLRGPLKDRIADRIAGLINRCGFDMIYFDGGECNAANGPYWYWVSQQQMAVWNRIERDFLVQGSGGTPWTWHIFARGCCDDFAAVAPKEYLDYHKIADSWRHYTSSFMPAELGWWGFLAHTPHNPATRPDEVECYAARMLALDTPVSMETHVSSLKKNGRTEEMLRLLGRWERLRLSGKVPAAVRERLREGEWHLEETDEKPTLRPVVYETHRLAAGQEATVVNDFGRQPVAFRLEAGHALARPGDAANRVLLATAKPALVPPPAEEDPMPGALAARVAFNRAPAEQMTGFAEDAGARSPAGTGGKALDLLGHRALAVTLRVDGPEVEAKDGGPCPVLNVQLESTAERYRDYYIDLEFRGERTVILPEPTTGRMLPEFRPAHANYRFKAAMYGYDYGRIVALNLRWMRAAKDQPVQCRVVRVEALAESEAAVARPTLAVGEARLAVPFTLKTGDYAEYGGEGKVQIFDANGNARGDVAPVVSPPDRGPVLTAGENRLRFVSQQPAGGGPPAAPVKLTVITLGEPVWP
ncbi:MAG: hypothetical protein R6X20_00575 [Phycisphaerae bacterium]